jgi:hypothetical protein
VTFLSVSTTERAAVEIARAAGHEAVHWLAAVAAVEAENLLEAGSVGR